MLEIVFLAIVQGIAEFLPVSSSGHLVILGAIMGELSESPTVEILLHAGTLASILVIYWRRILDLLLSDRHVIVLLVVGTVPAAVTGLLIKSQAAWLLRDPQLAGWMLVVTGGMLIVLGRLRPAAGTYRKLSPWGAFTVGAFQALAILPGISRSGSTILGGRLLGLNKEDSITFSFLLAIPAILGATVLELKDLLTGSAADPAGKHSAEELAIGTIVAFFVGIAALKWLIGWSRRDRLHWFAWWCIPAGLAAAVAFAGGWL